MMNIMVQITDNDTFKITKLELHELFIGNIIYIVIFLVLVVVAFKKEECIVYLVDILKVMNLLEM